MMIMDNETLNRTDAKTNRALYSIGIAGIVLFTIDLFLVVSGNSSFIDDPVRCWFYDLRQEGLNSFVTKFTLAGNWQTITALCMILLVLPPTRKDAGLPLSIGNGIITTTNKLIKHLVQRIRPDMSLFLIDQGGFSFPSGHSISSMYTYGLLLYFTLTKLKSTARKIVLAIVLTVLAFGIGLSRIYVGVHFPTDVLAGWSLGALGVVVTVWILQRFQSNRNDP